MHTRGSWACLLRLTSCPPSLGTKMPSLREEPLLVTRKGQRWGSDLGKQEMGASEKSFRDGRQRGTEVESRNQRSGQTGELQRGGSNGGGCPIMQEAFGPASK